MLTASAASLARLLSTDGMRATVRRHGAPAQELLEDPRPAA